MVGGFHDESREVYFGISCIPFKKTFFLFYFPKIKKKEQRFWCVHAVVCVCVCRAVLMARFFFGRTLPGRKKIGFQRRTLLYVCVYVQAQQTIDFLVFCAGLGFGWWSSHLQGSAVFFFFCMTHDDPKRQWTSRPEGGPLIFVLCAVCVWQEEEMFSLV